MQRGCNRKKGLMIHEKFWWVYGGRVKSKETLRFAGTEVHLTEKLQEHGTNMKVQYINTKL